MEDRYLFRGKRIDTGKWVEGYFVQTAEGSYIVVPYKASTILGEGSIIEVDASTICQCTGLKDKNGKLIWENDIVRFDIYKYEKMISSIVSDVQWCDEIWSFSIVVNAENNRGTLGHVLDFNKEVKVIGNKFDNPELLEVQE